MVSFELGKDIEKDVFHLVTTFGFRAPMLYLLSHRLYGERGLLRGSYDTHPAYC